MAALHAFSLSDRDIENEDTIELQMTPTQVEVLARAAEEAERERGAIAVVAAPLAVVADDRMPALAPVRSEVATSAASGTRKSRPYVALVCAAAILVLAVTLAYRLGARTRPVPPATTSPPTHVTEPARQMPPAAPPAPGPRIEEIQDGPRGTPVRFTNPFDATEVFEFPPGTSPAAARDAVADLLLKRAQERQPTWRSNGALHSPQRPPDDPRLAQRS